MLAGRIVATFTPEALDDLSLTVDLGERLALVFVFGPGYLVSGGFDEVERALGAGRRVLRHRLDRLGPNVAETIVSVDEPRPVVLVSGLERMANDLREQTLESMNLLRDTLSKHAAVVVMWIPEATASAFRRLCVDLFQWRTMTMFVEGAQDDERRFRHDYLVALENAFLVRPSAKLPTSRPALPVTAVGELQVRVAGASAPMPIETWLGQVRCGLLLGSAGSGKSTALGRYAARRAAQLLDGGGDPELPLFLSAHHLRGVLNLDSDTLAPAVEHTFDYHFDPVSSYPRRKWFAQQLASAPVVLLVDDFDESKLFKLLGELEHEFRWLAMGNPRLRMVLAARDAQPLASHWQQAEVLPLQPGATQVWLRNAGYDPEAFMSALPNGFAEELAGHPLSLQIVAEHLSRRGYLPEVDWTALLDSIVQSKLGGWDEQSGVTSRLPESTAFIRDALGTLAAAATRDRRESVGQSVLRDIVGEPDKFLHFVDTRSGIIQWDPGNLKYRFVHPMFREYFAGYWLSAQEFTPEQLARYAADPLWQRPTFHALWFLAPRELERVAAQIWDISAEQPPLTRWAMRALVLRRALAHADRGVRLGFIARAKAALQQAQREGQSPELWASLDELLERAEEASG